MVAARSGAVCVSKRFPDRLVNFDGFDVGLVVHGLPQAGKFKIDDSSGAILVAQWTVFGDGVPRVKGELAREQVSFRRIELLPGNADPGYGHEWRYALGPFD